jgi:hypothetical protein
MMAETDIERVVEATASELVHLRNVGSSRFLNLPLVYPDGSSVTVKIDPVKGGIRVSDNGFAYREAEALGAQRSFGQVARNIAEDHGVNANRRVIYTDATPQTLHGAITDVATASWLIASRIFERVSEGEEAEIEAQLAERLEAIFGSNHVKPQRTLHGASSSEWKLSAIVTVDHHIAAFQAVSGKHTSIYRTVAAFHDLASLERPPTLVAVVESKKALGPRLGLLSQAGRVIEEGQPDEVFRKAAA